MAVEADNQIWCAETRVGSGLIEIFKIGGLSTHQPIIPDPTPTAHCARALPLPLPSASGLLWLLRPSRPLLYLYILHDRG